MATASGNVRRVKRKRGDKWYAQCRLPDGRQVQKIIGPAASEKGRPLEGEFTRKMAQAKLREILADAQRGVGETQPSGATFRDARLSTCATSNRSARSARKRLETTGVLSTATYSTSSATSRSSR